MEYMEKVDKTWIHVVGMTNCYHTGYGQSETMVIVLRAELGAIHVKRSVRSEND
jgi:hypothetical protein